MNNCKDCDNKTDGVCCHQSIRNTTDVKGVESAIKHEFDCIENRQNAKKHKSLFSVIADLGDK